MITRDDLISDATGRRCGVVGNFTDQAELLEWSHATLVVDVTDPASWKRVRTYEHLGFHLVSLSGTFEGMASRDFGTRLHVPSDDMVEKIRLRAGSLFVHSRFHTDPFFSVEDANKIHAAKISQLHLAGQLYVAGLPADPHGFVGIELRDSDANLHLDLELLAALDGRRGSGSLTLGAVGRAGRLVRTRAQLSNLPACRLYQKSGLRLAKTEAILTWSHP